MASNWRQAQRRVAAGVTRGLSVTTLLADALDALAPVWEKGTDGAELDAELRARALFTEAWARTLRGDPESAAARLGRIDRSTLPERWRVPLADALARARHAAGDPRGAAEAFLEAGNVHGAAASRSAARDATETARLYGQLLVAAPTDTALQAEALRAARYAEAASPLADALAPLVEAGTASSSLEATRAEALGIAGRNEEAIAAWRALKLRDDTVPGLDASLATRLAARGKPGDLDEAVDLAVAQLAQDPESTLAGDLLWAIAAADYENLRRTRRTVACSPAACAPRRRSWPPAATTPRPGPTSATRCAWAGERWRPWRPTTRRSSWTPTTPTSARMGARGVRRPGMTSRP
ncbi:MAG: hypothetical protein R3F05_12375 [Planctomycetota bacterium]